jgi:hydroxymethylglutaryl-CoA synthase
VPSLILEQSYEDSLSDKALEKLFIGLSKERFTKSVQQSLTVPTMCGNMYTAGVYSGLISLLSNVQSSELLGRRVGVYSFGSGLASTLFSLRVVGDVSDIVSKIDLHARLAARERVSPKFYDEVRQFRTKHMIHNH